MRKLCSTQSSEAPCSFSRRFDSQHPPLPCGKSCRNGAGNARGLRHLGLIGAEGRQAVRASRANVFLAPRSADDLGREGSTPLLNRASDAGYALAPEAKLQNHFSRRGQGADTRALVPAIAPGVRRLGRVGKAFAAYYTHLDSSEARRDTYAARQAPTGSPFDLLGPPRVAFMKHRTAAPSHLSRVRAALSPRRSTGKAPGLALVLAARTRDLPEDTEPA